MSGTLIINKSTVRGWLVHQRTAFEISDRCTELDLVAGVWKGWHSAYDKGRVLARLQEASIRLYHKRLDDDLNA